MVKRCGRATGQPYSTSSTASSSKRSSSLRSPRCCTVLQTPPAALAACAASRLSSGRSFCTSTSSRYSCSAEGCDGRGQQGHR